LIKAGANIDLMNNDGELALEMYGINSNSLDPVVIETQRQFLLELHRIEKKWKR
jgi:hypothetical protein